MMCGHPWERSTQIQPTRVACETFATPNARKKHVSFQFFTTVVGNGLMTQKIGRQVYSRHSQSLRAFGSGSEADGANGNCEDPKAGMEISQCRETETAYSLRRVSACASLLANGTVEGSDCGGRCGVRKCASVTRNRMKYELGMSQSNVVTRNEKLYLSSKPHRKCSLVQLPLSVDDQKIYWLLMKLEWAWNGLRT